MFLYCCLQNVMRTHVSGSLGGVTLPSTIPCSSDEENSEFVRIYILWYQDFHPVETRSVRALATLLSKKLWRNEHRE
jgi:hypothetical protein